MAPGVQPITRVRELPYPALLLVFSDLSLWSRVSTRYSLSLAWESCRRKDVQSLSVEKACCTCC